MKIASKKALTLMASLLLFVVIATVVGLKPLADSAEGSSGPVESAISSTDVSVEETSSETESEPEVETTEGTSEGLSEGYSGDDYTLFSTRSIINSSTDYVDYGAEGAILEPTAGLSLTPGTAAYQDMGGVGGIYEASPPASWNPFNEINTTGGGTFKFPVPGRTTAGVYYYSYYEFKYTNTVGEAGKLTNLLNQLYPDAADDFAAYKLNSTGFPVPTSPGAFVTVDDIKGFMSNSGPYGFWTKYKAYLGPLITGGDVPGSQLDLLRTAYSSMSIGPSGAVSVASDDYYFDITSQDCLAPMTSLGVSYQKLHNGWFYLLGYSEADNIYIYGASGEGYIGSDKWGGVGGFDAMPYDTAIVGYGTGAASSPLYDGTNIKISLAGGADTSIGGFWGARGGGTGSRLYSGAGASIAPIEIASYVTGEAVRPSTQQKFRISSFGGNLSVMASSNINSIEFGGYDSGVNRWASAGDVTLPKYLDMISLSGENLKVIASPAMFGVRVGAVGNTVTTRTAREINFIGTGGTFNASNNSPVGTTTGATVPIAQNISWLDCGSESWTASGLSQFPNHNYSFTNTQLGCVADVRTSFTFAGASKTSVVTANIGTLGTASGGYKYTFVLDAATVDTFKTNEADLQLILARTTITNVSLVGGIYNSTIFSGDMTAADGTIQALRNAKSSTDDITTLVGTAYQVVTVPITDSGVTTLPFIETLTLNGSGYDYSTMDLKYSEAKNIVIDNNFAASHSTATILLPDRTPDGTNSSHQNLNSLDISSGDTITFTGAVTTNPTTLNLYGSKELNTITFDNTVTGSLGNSLKTLDISSTASSGAPGVYPPRLEVQPKIIGWDKAPPDKELIVHDTAIKAFYSFEDENRDPDPMYPQDLLSLDLTSPNNTASQLEKIDIRTGLYMSKASMSGGKLKEFKYKQGNETVLNYLDLSGQDKIGSSTGSALDISQIFSKQNEINNNSLSELKEVRYNALTQLVVNPASGNIDIDLSDNQITIFQMSNCTPTTAVDGYGVHDLNLSGNRFTVIENLNNTSTATNGNGFWCVNTPILGTIDFSKNKLTKVSLDGTQSVIGTGSKNFGKTIDLSNQQNTISIPELSATPFGDISDGVTIQEIDNLESLVVKYDKITGFDLENLTNLQFIEGAAHHSSAGVTSPELLIAGRASFDNAGPNLSAPAGASGAKKELNFEGHAITYLTIKNMGDFDVLNFRRQNSTGDVAPTAEQGALQTVNLVAGTGSDIDTLDVSFNSIERVDNASGALLSGTMNYTGVTFTGNALVNADYNNISKVNIKGTQFVSGADTLKTLRLNDNLLIDLTYTDSASLEKLLVNRSVADRNTFANGSIILTNASALEAFAPATSVAADKAEDSQFNRIKLVIPSESRWAQDSPGGITPQFADFTNLSGGTFGTDFGFYHSVQIANLDISGASSMTTLRVPGNYLTNSSINWSGTGNMEFLDVSGAPYLTTDANGTVYAGTSTTKSRGDKYTTINVRPAGTQDARSGQITGAFVGQWPKLQSLYIQNNKIQQLDVGTSTNLVHILAYQNQLGQGLTSDAVKVTTATALKVLDVERNPNIRVLAVPTQNLEILRAGLAGLTAYPNVHNITTLKQLYVDHNNLSGDAEEVAGNPNLEVLNISANNFTTLPNVSSLAKLEEYYAYNNQAKSLGDFNNSGKLAILDVSDNLIEAWPTLPSSIVYLDLSRNRFAGILDISGIPAGISRATPYTAKAHEVTALEGFTDKGAVYNQTSNFYGTFAIADNQITVLPDTLEKAYTDMVNNVSGRLAYRMFVNWNVLDIDIYGLDSNGNPVATYTGTQKWVAPYPGVKATLLNFVYDDKLKMVLEGSVGLYDPRSGLSVEDINAFEAPYDYQEWEYSWEDTLGLVYGEKIDRDGVALGKVRIIDNQARNGRAVVGVTLYGPQMNTNSIKEWNEDGTKTVDGSQDSGQVLDDLKGNNANYNPTTGALGNEE